MKIIKRSGMEDTFDIKKIEADRGEDSGDPCQCGEGM